MIPHRRSRLVAIVQVCLALGLLVLTGCGTAELSEVPAELLGTWRIDAPGYERSYLEIAPRRFVIGMGSFELYDYAIDRIETDTDRSGDRIVELHYTAEAGYPDKLVLIVDQHATDTFTLGSRSQTWVRDS